MVAIAIICLLTYINSKGVKEGKFIQTIFTSAKLFALFGLIAFGFLLVKESFWAENWKTGFNAMQDLGQKMSMEYYIPPAGLELVALP